MLSCCHEAVSCESCLLVEASLSLEAAERPQWPRVYLLGRPKSCGRMPSLVGDSGQVLSSGFRAVRLPGQATIAVRGRLLGGEKSGPSPYNHRA